MENTNKSFITIKNVEKIYPNGEKAVYNFNLDIERNEFIVIVGPSGCGKSTTLRMIAGLEDISSGEMYMEDELLNFKACKDRNMAIVFQSYALYPQMNVFNNIAFPLTINKYPAPVVDVTLFSCDEVRKVLERSSGEALLSTLGEIVASKAGKDEKTERIATVLDISYGGAKRLFELYSASGDKLQQGYEAVKSEWLNAVEAAEKEQLAKNAQNGVTLNDAFCQVDETGAELIQVRKLTSYEIKKKVYETAEKLDLTPYLDKLPRELSGGQMQRVALGRAIIKNVPVFLMDEPLSNLDAKLRLTMRSEIVKLHNRINATTIYVTHDQTEAMTMASRIVVMSRGFIQQIATPEEVYNSPANLFVAKFIGSPSMNLFDMEFDRDKLNLQHDEFNLSVDKRFVEKHDAFYKQKIEDFRSLCDNFDDKARESILKILSATGESVSNKQKSEAKGLIAKIKDKLSKSNVVEDVNAREKQIAQDKLSMLEDNLKSRHTLTLGIRPERVQIEKVQEGKKYDSSWYITKPTICELLGGEYSVHFDFCDKDMVARLDAKTPINTADTIAVKFDLSDIYVFDPVTCDVVKSLD